MKIITKDQFIATSKNTHKLIYDYSLIPEEMYLIDKVWLICPKHGKIQVTPNYHFKGHECNKCILEQRSIDKLNPSKVTKFFNDCRLKHTNPDGTPKYIYDESTYLGTTEPIDIYCPVHDYHFKQRGNMHLFGRGCKYCGYDSMKKELTLTQEIIIERLKKLFPKFNFDKTVYDGTRIHSSYLIIQCPEHGDFQQNAQSALFGKCGCSKCTQKTSQAEIELQEYVQSIYFGEIVFNSREIIKPKELDIYLPELHLAIEYNGLFWHSDYKRDNNYHLQKTIDCEEKQIQLIHIFEDEWLDKKEIVKSRIANIIGITKYKVFARKCSVRQLTIKEEKNFMNNNHLQGYIASTICYGLIYNYNGKEVILSCMCFGDLRKNLGSDKEDSVYEMYRFCNQLNFNIVGGASKLLKHFLKQIKPIQVISYADKRWSTGNLYKQLGFEYKSTSKPNYFYVDNKGIRYNRYSFRKDILVSKYDADSNKTENQITYEMGLSKIYDCGTLKYIFNNKLS